MFGVARIETDRPILRRRRVDDIGMTRVERVVDTRKGIAASLRYAVQAPRPR